MSENQQVEGKELWRDEYLKWICGFANAQGGVLEIGRNDRGKAVGVNDADKLMEDLPNKMRDTLGIIADVDRIEEGGETLIRITVEPYPYPVSYKGEYHYRTGATKQALKGAALDRFLLGKTGKRWDSVPQPYLAVGDLDEGVLAWFRKEAVRRQRLPEFVLNDDKIMIWNDGHLPENWTIAELLGSHASIPYNPDIARVFFLAGKIEAWGSGIERMIAACVAHRARSHFSPRNNRLVGRTSIHPKGPSRDQGTKLALSRHQVEILDKSRDENTLQQLMEVTGRSDRTKFRNQVLKPLLESGLIAMTIPDKPRSSKTLYDANREVYGLLRYGVKVRPDIGEQNVTVWLIDWENPDKNDFAIAEEVTVAASDSKSHDKRPDIVLYVNGIALGVLELKRSTISVTEGIRQNLDNQKKEFIRPFFATVQLVMAGNDTEGLRYGVIKTKEKYWLSWKEENANWTPNDPPDIKYLPDDQGGSVTGRLHGGLKRLVSKDRLLTLIHDFTVFDAGTKKTCRHNQFFGVLAAQQRVKRREGGIIWHTQGSGKSLTMVWLAKWIREHVTNSRVLIITDRTELDEQIEKVFKGVSEDVYRTKSGADLVNVLNYNEQWLVCSLIHKFGASEEGDIDAYLKDIQSHLPKGFRAKGELFVFVDECHRTQSGKLHEAMKLIVPGAMLIGFTGTPLLKKDKQKSIEVFGPYIHTYKYNEAVRDGVVLDLRYEARDIDQYITSQKKVDDWFEVKTKGLSELAKAQLKQRWGTMQKVLSSKSRLEMIVDDMLMDMATRDRLQSGHGNAMLVSDSVYSACRFFEMFQKTDMKGKCAIVTSYKPTPGDIKGEETGEGLTEKLRKYDIYRKMLADYFGEPEESAMYKVERFEKEVKQRFIDQPGQMKLLIVVDKLLTGFDAPAATYLYIDKKMENHGLFQAICRVNRLDSDDKEYGYIIDYKDLFKSLEKSIQDYTGEAFDGFDEEDVAGLLKHRLEKAKERLEELREAIKALCEPVQPPRDQEAHLRFFCGTSEDPDSCKENESKRVALYKLTASLVRAYANLANEMQDAGYTAAQTQEIKTEVRHFENLREEVKLRSADYVDMKVFEPAMRHLLDTYIRAEESEQVSAFDDMTLVELILERGEDAVTELPKGLSENPEAMAETIENNVRKVIIDEMAVNPKYYEKMSELLDELIKARKTQALNYKAYLAKVVELTKKVGKPETQAAYPASINSPPRCVLYDNLKAHVSLLQETGVGYDGIPPEDATADLAIAVDDAIRSEKKADFRGNRFKEREVRNAIKTVLGENDELVDTILAIVKHPKSGY